MTFWGGGGASHTRESLHVSCPWCSMTGVFAELCIDIENVDSADHSTVAGRTLNDSGLYVALLHERKSPPTYTHAQQTFDWFGKQQQDPPAARVRKHDWLHMPAFSTITTAGIYLATPPPPPTRKCVIGCHRGASGVRHSNIRESKTSLSLACVRKHTHT